MKTNPAVALYQQATKAVVEYRDALTEFEVAWRNFDGDEGIDLFEIAVRNIETACGKARAALEVAASEDVLYGAQNKLNARALPFIGATQVHVLATLLTDLVNELGADTVAAAVEH